jgi:hypothetical protein
VPNFRTQRTDRMSTIKENAYARSAYGVCSAVCICSALLKLCSCLSISSILQKNAWTRKHNCWRSQERKRQEAEARWALRQRMSKSALQGEYAFAGEYEEQLQRRAQQAQYRPPRLKYRGVTEDAQDPLVPKQDQVSVRSEDGGQQAELAVNQETDEERRRQKEAINRRAKEARMKSERDIV